MDIFTFAQQQQQFRGSSTQKGKQQGPQQQQMMMVPTLDDDQPSYPMMNTTQMSIPSRSVPQQPQSRSKSPISAVKPKGVSLGGSKMKNWMKWNERCKLLRVSIPEPLGDTLKAGLGGKFKSKKRYAIKVTYADEQGKIHQQTVRFGRTDQKDYVDFAPGDKKAQDCRAITCARLRNVHNFLHGNYYRARLLNQFPTMSEAFNNFLATHNLIQ